MGGMMSDEKDRKIIPSQGGVFNDLAMRVKLILRLLKDSRVNPVLKLIPIGSLLYFLIPDLVVGPVDDVAVIWLGSYLFVELCPPDVVQEHIRELTKLVPGEWHDTIGPEEDVIEGEFREKKE
jgi:hypothetical protein